MPASQPHKHTRCVVEGSDDTLATCFTEAINQDYPNYYRLRATGTANGATRHLTQPPVGGSHTRSKTQAETVRAKGL